MSDGAEVGIRPLGWFGRLSAAQRRAFWATFGGNVLDNLDFNLFPFLIPVLVATWRMSRGEAGLIATSTILAGALGGALAGVMADRFGRVRVLQFTILWFSGFTFLSGFVTGPTQLLVVRTLQGLGFGGELAVGATLIGETVQPRDRGGVMGGVASGYAIGSLAASLVYLFAFTYLPPQLAWRAALWSGVLPALLTLYIRKGVQEPVVFRTSAVDRQASPPFSALFGAGLRERTLVALLLVAGATAAQLTVVIWLPTWLRLERGLSVQSTGINAVLNAVGAMVGFLSGGAILDRIGRRTTFRLFAIVSLVLVGALLILPIGSGLLPVLAALVGISLVITGVGITPLLSEIFPTPLRARGLGFCYGGGRAVGALSPGLVGMASEVLPMSSALLIAVGFDLLLVLVGASLLPETNMRDLSDGSDRASGHRPAFTTDGEPA